MEVAGQRRITIEARCLQNKKWLLQRWQVLFS